ncbi:DoxX family protein [Neobacillus citreus]|uniref:DoxX family protein n=1 Tax=Neobacillus citreus TaxID=2833578 RepID=A0A942T7W5_9BACI|nr:DoxX family protein [Neobacillus citreus]MCH6268460.1 DoxX family protein [Neobacillus citreus]
MFARWLRENKIAAGILTVLRLYLGYSWFTAGFHKLTGGFDAAGFLKGVTANPVKGPDGAVVYGWYVEFLKGFALPNVDIFNFIVPWGEVLVGLGLMLGCLTTAAAFFALVMNFAFFLAGTVSHIPTDIFLGVIILAAGYNAGHFGLDRLVVPFFRKAVIKGKEPIKQTA